MERDDRRNAERRPLADEEREHRRERSHGRDDSHRGKDRGSNRRDHDRHHDDRRTDRRRSRSRSPRHRRSRSPRQWRSRSRSRDRDSRGYRGSRNDRRPDRPRYRDDKRDDPNKEPVLNGVPSSVAPQAVARIQAQLAKRRALWQNKDKPVEAAPSEVEQSSASSSGAGTAKVWKAAAFREDQDGKMSAKFKRLMGMKGNEAPGNVPESEDVLKQQADLFTNLDMQYERARAATHTAKGMGLGFGSLGSGVPR